MLRGPRADQRPRVRRVEGGSVELGRRALHSAVWTLALRGFKHLEPVLKDFERSVQVFVLPQ